MPGETKKGKEFFSPQRERTSVDLFAFCDGYHQTNITHNGYEEILIWLLEISIGLG